MSWLNRIYGLHELPTVDELVDEGENIRMQEQEAQQHKEIEVQQQAEEVPQGPRAIAYTQFILLEDGNLHIKLDWADTKPETGIIVGEFLQRLNAGKFKNALHKLLENSISVDARNKPFVKEVYKSWKAEELETNENPLIDPLQVFGFSRGRNQSEEE